MKQRKQYRFRSRGLWISAALFVTMGLAVAMLVPRLFAQTSPVSQAGASEAGVSQVIASRALSTIPAIWWVAPGGSALALLMAFYFYKSIMRAVDGNERMREIAQYVREGAYAYLWRQYKVVGIFFVVVSLVLALVAFGLEAQHALVPFAFLTGGFFSGLAGFFGMKTATNASSRTAQGACQSLNRGLQIAFRAGAVMGLTVVGLGLLDICMWFLYLYAGHHHIVQWLTGVPTPPMTLETITVVMLCFGMGASSQALFARVGGGIFTKAADVGADLVGKVEAGIPEDDPRNPATIADNVGDNVGDVAGMGADLYESYCGSILATAALGVAAAVVDPKKVDLYYLIAPMVLAGLGIPLSIIGIFVVRTREDATMKNLLAALGRGINLSSLLIVIAAAWLCSSWGLGIGWGIFGAIVSGLAAGILIGKATEYFTAADYRPTRRVAESSLTGPATVVLSGISEGMISTWVPISVVSAAMLLAFSLSGGWNDLTLGLYGVGIAAVGMLSTLGITLATDAYGPIADNAGGNAEMSHLGPEVRKRTDALDALGNTTAATGKGFAIGSAALTALALLAAYVEEVRVGIHREVSSRYAQAEQVAGGPLMVIPPLNGKAGLALKAPGEDEVSTLVGKQRYVLSLIQEGGSDRAIAVPGLEGKWVVNQIGEEWLRKSSSWAPLGIAEDRDIYRKKAGMTDYMPFYDITPMNPKFLVGVFFGVLLVFIFVALTMKAVGRAAQAMVQEVRRQFREIVGIMEGKGKPDYARCVEISTRGAQREMILPSLLALIVPLGTGLLLNVAGVMGLLVGGLCCGFAMAVFMANSGGSWDNAKKYIESGVHGGKGSSAHKAAVTGDTVGDPFKDTCGPSLNILIKLMSMVSVVFAGLIVKAAPYVSKLLFQGK